MPGTRQLRRLFEAIAEQNWASAKALAENIANAEAERGNSTASRTLRDALQPRASNSALPLSALNVGLSQRTRPTKLEDVFLPTKLHAEFSSLLDEHRHSEELLRAHLPTRRRLLLVGPPGCGKSLTAQALANELSLPFYIVRFDSLIAAYLGQTAVNLRQLFRVAETVPCVMLFDEIDAIGRQRGRASDVGELDRIVIALMQELELARPQGLIIATSNLPQHLDDALIRRFDASFSYPKPTRKSLRLYAKTLAARLGASLSPSILNTSETARSYADVEVLLYNHLRSKLLSDLRNRNGR